MITIKINGSNHNINTSWKDITYKHFKQIVSFDKEGEPKKFIALVSGLDAEVVETLPEAILVSLLGLISFVNEFDSIACNYVGTINIGSDSWYKLEKAKQAIAKESKFVCAAGVIIEIYTGKKIDELPITQVMGEVNYFLEQINTFFEKYKRLNEHEENADEFTAGVSRFEQFGFFASVVELSRKMGVMYDKVLNMTANEVYQTFLYDFEKADYEKTLIQIRNANGN